MKPSSPLIMATGLQKALTDTVRLNVSMEPGTFTCVIGPNSEEISAWLRILAGLDSFANGELQLLGTVLSDMDRESWQISRQDIGFVSAESALLSAQNIIDNILTPAYYHRLGTQEQLTKKAHDLLEQAGYPDNESLSLLPAHVTQEKRYLAMLVRALMLDPQVLFFDNLFAKIGVMAKNNVYTLLESRVKQMGMAVVINTRNLDFTAKYADTILFVSSEQVLKFTNYQQFLAADDPMVEEYKSKYSMR